MARRLRIFMLFTLLALPLSSWADPVDFVVQFTRADGLNNGHRRVLFQIDRVLRELGSDKVRFTVVAYEEGIHALWADNVRTATLVTDLANRGVVFKACRISMKASGLTEDDMNMVVDFVPAGAPEVLRLQMQGYRYWKP